jgi:Uma2 family endonuclease
MSKSDTRARERGPFRADQIREGDRYELHEGHPVYCAPTGSRGSRRHLTGASVLDTDPTVDEAGVDTGFSPEPQALRAPDIAVGNVPDTPGWAPGSPSLAVEYADTGQNEQELQDKIVDLLGAGTQLVWVVRLVGPRRVEVYEPGKPMRTVAEDGELAAPGILRNSVPVRAMYDREAAHEATLRNLLQRRGYANLDAVRADGKMEGKAEGKVEGKAEGKAEGKVEGKAEAVIAVLNARGLVPTDPQRARLLACRDLAELDRWLALAATASSLNDVFLD